MLIDGYSGSDHVRDDANACDSRDGKMRRVVFGSDEEVSSFSLWDARDGAFDQAPALGVRSMLKNWIKGSRRGESGGGGDLQWRMEGRDWPLLGHTMIGIKRLDNLQFCVERVLADDVPGDLIETGVWRGGATIFMRAILKAHGVTDRRVWVADSGEVNNVHLIELVPYLSFVALMERVSVLLTDSGEIQEEALSLGKPVWSCATQPSVRKG